MPVRTITEYLDTRNVSYRCYNHPPADTAMEVAESTHVPGHQLAKPVIVKADDLFVMAVLPADEQINLNLLRDTIGCDEIRLAHETEFSHLFPLCEIGGMPALGRPFGLPVYLDKSLTHADWIAFNAGTHTEVVKMDMEAFQRLEHPTICSFIQLH